MIADKYKTFWKRLFAAFIDGLVLYPLVLIDAAANNSASGLLLITCRFLSASLYISYFIILHAKYGQTAGKRLMNIKVVDISEINLIGFRRAVTRELPWIIANILTLIYLFKSLFMVKSLDLISARENYDDLVFITSLLWIIIELISMFTNTKRRAIHDWMAKSVVIKNGISDSASA